MGQGYWRHSITREQIESGYWEGAGAPDASAGAGAAPDGNPGEAGNPSEGNDYFTHREGSMSPRARQAYAAEALRFKDHVSAGLLAIFLGAFGVHKFYLGCNQAGFIMLAVSIIGGIFTFGLASAVIWLIAVIEGVIYLTKSQTEFDQIYVLNQRDWF